MQGAERRQPKPKPAAAHGITIAELKEMTRARLAKEGEEEYIRMHMADGVVKLYF